MADAGKRGKPAAPNKKSGPTKAQSEMDRFRARQHAGATPTGANPGAGFSGPVQWAFMTPPGGSGPGWSLPPSVMPMGQIPGGMSYPGAMGSGYPSAQDGFGGRLGSTLGLGVDVVNAVLAGSIGLLQRLGAGYGYAPQSYYGGGYATGCGCAGGCGCDPCKTECGYDCCCSLGCGTCCNPSVGSCC